MTQLATSRFRWNLGNLGVKGGERVLYREALVMALVEEVQGINVGALCQFDLFTKGLYIKGVGWVLLPLLEDIEQKVSPWNFAHEVPPTLSWASRLGLYTPIRHWLPACEYQMRFTQTLSILPAFSSTASARTHRTARRERQWQCRSAFLWDA